MGGKTNRREMIGTSIKLVSGFCIAPSLGFCFSKKSDNMTRKIIEKVIPSTGEKYRL